MRKTMGLEELDGGVGSKVYPAIMDFRAVLRLSSRGYAILLAGSALVVARKFCEGGAISTSAQRAVIRWRVVVV